MYKVVEGQVPAINIREYLTPQGIRRSVRAKSYKDHILSDNIVEKSVCYNTSPDDVISILSRQNKEDH
jgi:hypothetical protein